MNIDDMTLTILSAAGAYAVAAALLTMLPGPDTAIVIATAVNAGRRAAVRAAFGIAVGLLFWGAAASFGVAALLRASAEVYTIFRIVCVAYLVWLAFGALPVGIPPHSRQHVSRADRVARPPIQDAVGLPAGAPDRGHEPQARCVLRRVPAAVRAGGHLVDGDDPAVRRDPGHRSAALVPPDRGLAAMARKVLSRPRVRRAMDAVTGAVFVFFGARLALDA